MSRKFPFIVGHTVILTSLALPMINLCVAKVVLTIAVDGPSPIWPSVGIYLAVVLLWGYRVWPAILLSELIVNPMFNGYDKTLVSHSRAFFWRVCQRTSEPKRSPVSCS